MLQDRTRDPFSKGLRLLRHLMQTPDQAITVRDSSIALGMPPSTVHRLLATLAQENVLEQRQGHGQYAFSLDFYRLAFLAAGATPLREVTLRHAARLAAQCNEAAFFNLYDATRQQMMTISHAESTHPLRYAVDTQHWKPVHFGASGHGIMAFLPAAERQQIIERTGLAPATTASIIDAEQLEQDLATVRQRGYAFTRGQRTIGAVGLSAPIFGPDAAVLGNLCLTIPELRFDPAQEQQLAAMLIAGAAAIMTEIGGVSR